VKIGDLVKHQDRAWIDLAAGPPGIVLKISSRPGREALVDVYWTATGRTICAYTPNELRAFDENR
jgi:hypothetical protein